MSACGFHSGLSSLSGEISKHTIKMLSIVIFHGGKKNCSGSTRYKCCFNIVITNSYSRLYYDECSMWVCDYESGRDIPRSFWKEHI